LQRGNGIRLLFDLDFHEGKRPYAARICRATAPGCRRLRWQAIRLPYNSDHASRTHRTCAHRLGVAAAVSSGRFQQPSAAGDGGSYNRH